MHSLLAALAAPASGGSTGLHESSEEALRAAATRARDLEWLTRIRIGDAAAFEAMFREYADPLIRYGATYVEQSMASDLVADVFFAIWERRTEWNPQFGVAAYLYSAVRNRALNQVRSERRRRMWTDAASQDPTVSPASVEPTDNDNDRERDRAELVQKVRRLVDELPPNRREALLLRWEHQLSPEQIAEVMGVSRTAVYHLLERGMKMLRKLLGIR